MSIYLQNELRKLKKKIFSQCTIVEENLRFAIKSLLSKDILLAEKVIEKDTQIDNFEIEIEEDCLKMLALYQPVATDLRLIVSILKINTDLERVGDLAQNIGQRAKKLALIEGEVPDFDFNDMCNIALKMLNDSIDSLVDLDMKKAQNVIDTDNEIDAMNSRMYDIFVEQVSKDPHKMKLYLNYLSVSRYLERIADHATNISEDVIYMIEGTIVRHLD
ncbi:MAG: phosphate signaling complex protein PhoU [Candidatus Delongbacteria bacterium]|jgi:phosphate transport system protein|nr:phosphate signaling complex protein PhoU [Candidatus Delongbacteria bacterium]